MDIALSQSDRAILRALAARLAEIAASDEQTEKAAMWRRLNALKPNRPMTWIDVVSWHEFSQEIPLQCTGELARRIEWQVRTLLYRMEHFPADNLVDGVWFSPVVFHDSGIGVRRSLDEPELAHGAHHFIGQIRSEADIERIKDPVITPDPEATERWYDLYADLLAGVMPVQRCGVVHEWTAPWDGLVELYGINELFLDMVDNPHLVHKAIDRYMEVHLVRLSQLEQLGLLSLGSGKHRVGSGGIGLTDELPQPGYDPDHITPMDQWGTSTGQIFAEVSPPMFDEFCLQYEVRYLSRFGLNAYGCCEPLDHKIPYVKKIPRLRRISVSPWADRAVCAEQIGTDYVYSLKQNPAYLAGERFDEALIRRDLRESLEQARGCRVEILMKDVETVRSEPQRLAEWSRIALEEAERFGDG